MKGLLFTLFAMFVAYVYCQHLDINCPPFDENRKESVLVPHPCNCSTYYDCATPEPTPMPCPVGLHYNTETKKCDWPWIAKCKRSPNCPRTTLNDGDSLFEEVAA